MRWLVLASFLSGGCFELTDDFTCSTDQQCDTPDDPTGRCEDDHFCSHHVTSVECPSTRRYRTHSGPRSNTCVDVPDAGVPADLRPVRDLAVPDFAIVDSSVVD